MTFYETMARIMNEKGLCPVDITRASGVSAPYLTQLKTGHTKDPTWEKALRIIEALGVTPDEFVAVMRSDGEVAE